MTPTPRTHTRPLAAGTPAPDFTLPSTPDQKVSLSEFKGRPVILTFYPADWSPVCSDQLALYNELLSEFQRYDAQLIGLSVDGIWSHLAFAKQRNLHFPLLADFEPKGAVARAYGVYHAAGGTSERALFVIDRAGLVSWSYVSPMGVNPGADGILIALDGLGAGEAAVSKRHETAFLSIPVAAADHAVGPASAPVTLVEYGDFECPHCRRAHPIVQEVRRRLGSRLRFVFRNFPLTNVHPHAEHAAEVAEAAGAQGKFWEMHDRLFERQFALQDEDLLEYAGDLGLDAGVVGRELSAHIYRDKVRDDFMGGVRSGVNGTPTFYVNGVRHDASWDPDTLTAALERAAG